MSSILEEEILVNYSSATKKLHRKTYRRKACTGQFMETEYIQLKLGLYTNLFKDKPYKMQLILCFSPLFLSQHIYFMAKVNKVLTHPDCTFQVNRLSSSPKEYNSQNAFMYKLFSESVDKLPKLRDKEEIRNCLSYTEEWTHILWFVNLHKWNLLKR